MKRESFTKLREIRKRLRAIATTRCDVTLNEIAEELFDIELAETIEAIVEESEKRTNDESMKVE